jgi:hypothetical protein
MAVAHAALRQPETMKEGCHSDPERSEGEESRSASAPIAEQRTTARFLSRDCGIGMTGYFQSRGRQAVPPQVVGAGLALPSELANSI